MFSPNHRGHVVWAKTWPWTGLANTSANNFPGKHRPTETRTPLGKTSTGITNEMHQQMLRPNQTKPIQGVTLFAKPPPNKSILFRPSLDIMLKHRQTIPGKTSADRNTCISWQNVGRHNKGNTPPQKIRPNQTNSRGHVVCPTTWPLCIILRLIK